MAISEFEIKKCEKEIEAFMKLRRPPAHIRNKLDLGYRIHGQSVEIFEIRPQWRNPFQKMETPVAKTTFVKAQNCWKIFWPRTDLKWHGYEPAPKVKSFSDFLNIANADKHGCFLDSTSVHACCRRTQPTVVAVHGGSIYKECRAIWIS